jgi:hypothetical protein
MSKFLKVITSREFWAAFLAVLLLLFSAIFPNFPIDGEQLTAAVVLIIGYIVGTSIEGFPKGQVIVTNLKSLIGSRKFWSAIVGFGFVLLKSFKPDFPLTEDQILQVVLVLVSYIIGVGLTDRSLNLQLPKVKAV